MAASASPASPVSRSKMTAPATMGTPRRRSPIRCRVLEVAYDTIRRRQAETRRRRSAGWRGLVAERARPSASVPRVPGAPPRTSTPGTAPPGTSTTVQPVRPASSVQCPTDTPPGSRPAASGWFAVTSASWRWPQGYARTAAAAPGSMIAGPASAATAGA
jgi:hypothetical protein